jgi:spore maturation protein SpmB
MRYVAYWRKWLRAAGIRALKTMAQTAAAAIGTGAVLSDVDWALAGSAALAAAAELIETWGPDSLVGRTAAVMLGSSETTFYVMAVYLAAAEVRHSRWAVPAALCADLACFLSSAWICRLLWG